MFSAVPKYASVREGSVCIPSDQKRCFSTKCVVLPLKFTGCFSLKKVAASLWELLFPFTVKAITDVNIGILFCACQESSKYTG